MSHRRASDLGLEPPAVTFPRQPETVIITPSNPSPWYGFPAEGDRLTAQQKHHWAELGRDDAPEIITVFREATTREMWWSSISAPPVFQFDCPVIKRLADGRIRVISPYGMDKIVLASGWVKEPSKRNRHLLPPEQRRADWRKPGQQAGRRLSIGAAVLAALLLGSMLFRSVLAAQLPPGDASNSAVRVASAAVSQPLAPAEEAGRSPTLEVTQ